MEPSNLLVYNAGEGWERLCEFLGKEVPDKEFPYENKGGTKGSIPDQYVNFDVFTKGDREARNTVLSLGFISVLSIGGFYFYCTQGR